MGRTKLTNFINYRMKVLITDGRKYIGRFMAFDRHLNLVLGDCEEFRYLNSKKGLEEREERRVLGLAILRGEEIISLSIEGRPPADTVRSKPPSAASGSDVNNNMVKGILTTNTSQICKGLLRSMKNLNGSNSESIQLHNKHFVSSAPFLGARPSPGVIPNISNIGVRQLFTPYLSAQSTVKFSQEIR